MYLFVSASYDTHMADAIMTYIILLYVYVHVIHLVCVLCVYVRVHFLFSFRMASADDLWFQLMIQFVFYF